ncbi:MAG: transposase [Nitrospira sp.]|nr:transposase [Nitrospira sp.]
MSVVGIRVGINGIISAIRYGLQWRDAPNASGPYKTRYNRFVRWSRVVLGTAAPFGSLAYCFADTLLA